METSMLARKRPRLAWQELNRRIYYTVSPENAGFLQVDHHRCRNRNLAVRHGINSPPADFRISRLSAECLNISIPRLAVRYIACCARHAAALVSRTRAGLKNFSRAPRSWNAPSSLSPGRLGDPRNLPFVFMDWRSSSPSRIDLSGPSSPRPITIAGRTRNSDRTPNEAIQALPPSPPPASDGPSRIPWDPVRKRCSVRFAARKQPRITRASSFRKIPVAAVRSRIRICSRDFAFPGDDASRIS